MARITSRRIRRRTTIKQGDQVATRARMATVADQMRRRKWSWSALY